MEQKTDPLWQALWQRKEFPQRYRKFFFDYRPKKLLIHFDLLRNRVSGRHIRARWFDCRNFGDALNPFLIKYISGVRPGLVHRKAKNPDKDNYVVIGSTMTWLTNNHSTIWGAGFISADQKFRHNVKPKKICAVRGPLTRELILKQGIDCPEVYGDPALLLPLFYDPHVEKKYELGIVPHCHDTREKWLERIKDEPGVLMINICKPYKEIIKDLKSCKRIASSALHGIIAGDAYGIPTTWIELSSRVTGGGFKFRDYFMSVGRKDREPLVVTEETSLMDIYDQFHDYKIDIDLEKLLDACPFKKDESVKESLGR